MKNLAVLLVLSLLFSNVSGIKVSAAKKVSITKKVRVTVGKKCNIKLKNKKKVTWKYWFG